MRGREPGGWRSCDAAAPGPFVELHPRLAARLGAAEGEPVAVVSRRGRAVAPARITTGIRPDTVFMPFHWPGEGRANTLTNPALDPTSRMPEFKVCAPVNVHRGMPPPPADHSRTPGQRVTAAFGRNTTGVTVTRPGDSPGTR
ncbi:Periplasmic nitrate reductase [Streptomyces fumanus]